MTIPTVRVRILVAVDRDRRTEITWDTGDDKDTRSNLNDQCGYMRGPIAHHWIEADIPLPEPETTIEGKVKW